MTKIGKYRYIKSYYLRKSEVRKKPRVSLPPQMYTIACFGVDSDLLDSILTLL